MKPTIFTAAQWEARKNKFFSARGINAADYPPPFLKPSSPEAMDLQRGRKNLAGGECNSTADSQPDPAACHSISSAWRNAKTPLEKSARELNKPQQLLNGLAGSNPAALTPLCVKPNAPGCQVVGHAKAPAAASRDNFKPSEL